MPQDSYNNILNVEDELIDDCVDEAIEKDRSTACRRINDSKRATSRSKKTLDVVVAKTKRKAADATKDQLVRGQKKCKNVSKKVHEKKH